MMEKIRNVVAMHFPSLTEEDNREIILRLLKDDNFTCEDPSKVSKLKVVRLYLTLTFTTLA